MRILKINSLAVTLGVKYNYKGESYTVITAQKRDKTTELVLKDSKGLFSIIKESNFEKWFKIEK
jgi:hypothetical protein